MCTVCTADPTGFRSQTMNVIYRYCIDNWQKLDSFMLFFVKNVGNYHWVLDVAVNPFRMISVVTGATLGECGDSLLYGFMHIDPLESDHRDGTISASGKTPNGSPMHVSKMIFLLNCMSRYRDLKIHGLLETFEPIQSIEYLFAMGCSGPFGRVFTDNNSQLAHVFWKNVPDAYFPQLKTTKNTLPIQADGYNCGVYVIFSIQDMVITQRKRQWFVSDVPPKQKTRGKHGKQQYKRRNLWLYPQVTKSGLVLSNRHPRHRALIINGCAISCEWNLQY
jgi:hypothetical protein